MLLPTYSGVTRDACFACAGCMGIPGMDFEIAFAALIW